ncbi:MAG TPA: Rrf2 family transcriptional regulator [Gemmatimonadales bacterium]|jgi:Rrf2 family protein
MLSQTAEYALRAVLHLAQHGDTRPIRVNEMADALHIPQNYLSKILHQLTRHRVLVSLRGKAGGFRLADRPDELSLSAIVTPFDRVDERRRCLLGRPQCSDRTACAAHTRWKDVADTVAQFFRETTVADLLEREATLPA